MPAAHVQHVVFLVDGASRGARALRPELAAWFRGLTGWLEVWTEQVLRTEPVKRWEPRLWQSDAEAIRERPYFLETLVEEVQQIVARGASRADWQRAAALADTPIPLAWEVIAAARQAIEHGQHRRAAIECGTATEQAVTAAVGAAGTKLPLGRLLKEKYAPLGLAPPDEVERLKKRVVNVRNAAVHDGYQPTEREARMALREAEAIANKHVPLPPDQRRPS